MPTEPVHSSHAPRLSFVAALAGAALFLVLILFIRESQKPVETELTDIAETDRWKYTNEGRAEKLKELRAREQSLATTYDWVDKKAGIVRLPLEQAMQLTVREQAAKQH